MIDISVALRAGTPEWPGDTPYSCGWTWAIAAGASVNVSALTMSPHVGTHADAPIHVRDGWPASDALPLSAFVGPAAVLDVSGLIGAIEMAALDAAAAHHAVSIARVERLLLRTGRTIADGAFPESWPAPSVACIQALVARGLRLLGVDCPSVDDRDSKGLETHHALFAAGAYNIENLDLRAVGPGIYELLAAPLKIADIDAAPLRAVLRQAAVSDRPHT